MVSHRHTEKLEDKLRKEGDGVTNLREEGTAVKLREQRQPVNPALFVE